MLKSLFGELGPPERERPGTGVAAEPPSATALAADGMPFGVHGRLDEGDVQNVFVTGSPAQAMREHFRALRAQGEAAAPMLTLIDPGHHRAPALLRALAGAAGAPLERMLLREQATLRQLASIERVGVPRHRQPPIKVYQAEGRDGGNDEAEVVTALAERSQLTVVLMAGASSDGALHTLRALLEAVRQSTWRCPALAFFVPADNTWLAARIGGADWPPHLKVDVFEAVPQADSALWQDLLQLWEQVDGLTAADTGAAAEGPDLPLVARLLAQLVHAEGLDGCALVDAAAGTVLAGELPLADPGTAGGPVTDTPGLQRAALACSLALRSHLHAARTLDLPPVEEITLAAGDRMHVMRLVASRPGWFLLALLDRRRTNATLVRFKLMEAEKNL
jgi:hypothetical protein